MKMRGTHYGGVYEKGGEGYQRNTASGLKHANVLVVVEEEGEGGVAGVVSAYKVLVYR